MTHTICEKSVDGGYDSGYIRCGCFWGTEPGSLIKRFETTQSLAGLCTLDAGCGEGKNAAYLADAGSNVDAIDISSLAITNALRLFGERSRVSWRTANIMDGVIESERYDLVIALSSSCESIKARLPLKILSDSRWSGTSCKPVG